MSAASKKLATWEDLARLGERFRGEVIHGAIVEKASPTFDHGHAQATIAHALHPYHRRPGGNDGPGGWWFGLEVDVAFAEHEVYRPDVAGWRRERMPKKTKEWPVRLRPDWVCEILSESNARQDQVTKLAAYHQFRVPHYWIVDPMREHVTAYAWREEGYVTIAAAARGERLRAAPFDAIAIAVGDLFGDDDDQGPPDKTT